MVYINDACDFLALADDIILEAQFPNSPNTMMEMIKEADEEFKRIDLELNSLINQIRALKVDGDLFSNSLDYIEEWRQYRLSKAKSEASVTKGGSFYPIIYTQSMINTTKALIKELKAEYKYTLKTT